MKVPALQETNPTIPEELVLWDSATVRQVVGWSSPSALYNAIKKYGFPEPVRIGNRKSLWRKKRVLEWIAGLEEGFDADNRVNKEGE